MDFGFSGRDSLLYGVLAFPSLSPPDLLLLSAVPVPAAVQPRFSLVFSSFFSPF